MRSGPPFTSEAGVSLLEMLAALAIVAVMATAVVVTADFGDSPEDEAGARLVRALDEARREALVSGEIIGFSADPDGRGYRFFRYGQDAWMERRDHPALEPVRFSDPDLALHLDTGGVSRRLGGESEGEQGARPVAPQVWFDPAGFDDPFAYRLTGARGGAGIVRGDDGGLQFVGEPGEAQP
ncbi:MAG: GspH/FimT family pseudopilin [Oceanicaulis sp.]